MNIIDQLEVLDGFIDGEQFIMRGIAGNAVSGIYKSDGLRSFARVIDNGQGFNLTIDKERTIFITADNAEKLKRELFAIADELEGA